jgi:hypothetical protein
MRNTAKTRPAKPSARSKYSPQPKRNVLNTSQFSRSGPVFFSFLQVLP